MSDRLYKIGLIVLGVLCVALTPLAIMGIVSPSISGLAFATVVAWIIFRVVSRARSEAAAQHDARPR